MPNMPVRGVSLFVKIVGQGYPLVLMHGGPGADHISMLPFRRCADQCTLVFYDHRCNGRSAGAPVSTMTWENLTADADALRQMLGFEKWAVLGHSFGGMVALEYALRYPASLSHLILVDTCGDSRWARENAPKVLAQRGYSPDTVEMARRFFNGEIAPNEMLPALMKFGSAYYHHLNPVQFAQVMASGLRVKTRPEAQIFGFGHLLKGWTVMDRLGEIRAPTLVMAGRDDFQFPPEHQTALAAGIPNAHLKIIERAGHNAPSERPAEVVAAVKNFLAPVVSSHTGQLHGADLAGAALSGKAKQAMNTNVFHEISVYIQQQMRRLSIPGATLAIVQGDQIVHQRGFGRARPGGAAPTPQTPFFIGSLTKSFTALAVMQLVEAGKVELDAPVQHYLPWFRVADSQASSRMTVRHLLHQTSGLPMLRGMADLGDTDNSSSAAGRQARALSTLKLSRPVGAAFEYSNLNYNLLGLIVEAASGQSYEEYVQRHIFTPLAMDHTYTSPAAARQDGLAVGHRYWFAHPVAVRDLPVPRGSLPSGQLISTAEDLAHYLIAHLNGGCYKDAQILSKSGIEELHRGVAEQKVMNSTVGRYGMGWFESQIGRTTVIWHGGNVPDFSGYMALLPEQKSAVVLLINADHYGLPFVLPEVMGAGVAALLAGQQLPPNQLGFLPWTMRALPLIPLLQLAGVLATRRLIRRWRRDPSLRPGRGRLWGQHILLPLLPNLTLAAILAFLWSGGLLRYLHLYMPDLSWIVRLSGAFAGLWAVLRTGLILSARRKP